MGEVWGEDQDLCSGSTLCWASLVVQRVKNLPAMWETCVLPLGWEDALEEGMATHSSPLACRVPMDRGAWQATVQGITESDMTERLSTPCWLGDFPRLFSYLQSRGKNGMSSSGWMC